MQENSDTGASSASTSSAANNVALAASRYATEAAAAAGGTTNPSNNTTTTNADSTARRSLNTSSSNNVTPSRRFGYVSVVHNNKLVVWGGFDGSKWLNDMYEFDFSTKSWKEIYAHGGSSPTATLPTPRSCPAWAKDDQYVYLTGGYDGVERKSDFFACDLRTYTWYEMPCYGTPPSPRYFHSCCLYGNKMFSYGGYSGSERLSDMYVYDFETNHWSQVDYCGNPDSHNLSPPSRQPGWNAVDDGATGLSFMNNHYTEQQLDPYFNSSGSNSTSNNHAHPHPPNHHCTVYDVPSGRSSLVAQVYENYLFIFGEFITIVVDY